MGWFLIPKLGEKLSWGMYDIPSRKCSHIYDMKVTGKAMVHGIEGVELTAREATYSNKEDIINRTFVAQLTDTNMIVISFNIHNADSIKTFTIHFNCITTYSNKEDIINRTFVAQLTDTHCRYLATLRNDGEIRNYITFLDGDAFMPNWGFGQDNCGNETNLSCKGDIKRNGNIITSSDKNFLLDIVGRYTVKMNSKSFDTILDISLWNRQR